MAAWEGLLDLHLEPPIRGPASHVDLISLAATAGEQGDNAASPVEDDGARISWGGEGATQLVVGQDGGLDGRVLGTVVGIDASEGIEPIDATDGGACGQAVLHYKECFLVVDVEVLRPADLVILYDAIGLEEPISRVCVALPVLGLRKHEPAKLGWQKVATCGDIIVSLN